jgi:hypothetical protein
MESKGMTGVTSAVNLGMPTSNKNVYGSGSDIYIHTSAKELKDPTIDMIQRLSKDVYFEID